ncbi:phospholipase, partial [Halobacteriales archaeon QS_1_67_19]
MSPDVARAVALGALLLVASVPTAGLAAPGPTTAGNAVPEIVAIYPNPATDGDAGEFVVVRFPERTGAADWAVTDGESTAWLPNATVSGRVAVSPDPGIARNRTDLRVLGLDGHLSLANGGERVWLAAADGVTTGPIRYPNAPEGERWHRTDDGSWTWTPLGATDFEVARSGPARARAFVLPDAPDVPIETLRSADRRLLVAAYTFTSAR